MRVRKQGGAELIPRTTTVSEAGLKPMECLEIIWAAPKHGG
jgi:toluene monooxygenase system protein B